MSFVVDERGTQGVVIDRRARIGAKAAIAAGAVAGSPAVTGTGLLAETSADQGVSWRAVRSVACSPQRRTVTLASAWRTLLVLYCAADNYEAVADRATRAVAAQPRRPMFNPVPGFLARSALMIAAATPLFFLPRRLHVKAFVPLLALCFALAAVWLLPVFGWVVIGCVAVVGAQAAFNAIEHHRLPLSGGQPRADGASGRRRRPAGLAGPGASARTLRFGARRRYGGGEPRNYRTQATVMSLPLANHPRADDDPRHGSYGFRVRLLLRAVDVRASGRPLVGRVRGPRDRGGDEPSGLASSSQRISSRGRECRKA